MRVTRLKIELHKIAGGTKEQRDLYKTAIIRLEEAMNSKEFEDKVKKFKYTKPDGEIVSHFKENGMLNNEAIYSLIMSGKDKFNRDADYDIDLSVTLYNKRFTSAIGYTYPNTFKTWVNTKFWNKPSFKHVVAGISGNIAHEGMHNFGFSHAYKNNPTRAFTVPYAVGNIVYDLVLENMKDVKFKRKCTGFWRWKKCKWVQE